MNGQKIEIPGGGFVQLLDVLGSDLTVVNAARVSMDKESEWEKTCECGIQYDPTQRFSKWPGCGADERSCPKRVSNTLSERDRKLIAYLANHRPIHFTPFSQPQIQLRIRMPIFVARQWFKSTIGFTRNEVSRRYVDARPEFFAPPVWRSKAENVKQGSGGGMSDVRNNVAHSLLDGVHREAMECYRRLLALGVCPEQARICLPQSMFTEFVECASLFAYARIIQLRDEATAQQETGDYARAVRQLIEPLFPVSVAALLGGK